MAVIKIINQSSNALPQYETPGSAGMDVRANIESTLSLSPMERVLVPTGLSIELPVGYEMQVRPRSGLALKKGITLVNTPGTIDSDYRGEIKVLLINLSTEIQHIEPAERIAQLVVATYVKAQWELADRLEESDRGAGGFGSTGKH
jgi:dUTP pyrophosphatase